MFTLPTGRIDLDRDTTELGFHFSGGVLTMRNKRSVDIVIWLLLLLVFSTAHPALAGLCIGSRAECEGVKVPDERGVAGEDDAVLYPNTLLSYASEVGGIVLDGGGYNSPYATHLAQALTRRYSKVEEALEWLAAQVKSDTSKIQIPVFLNTLTESTLFTDDIKKPGYALVIGNNRHNHSPDLRNAVNDARLIATTLENRGFQVTMLADMSYNEFIEAFDSFVSSLPPGSIAVFYFAGHGTYIDGSTYMIPVDSEVLEAEDIHVRAISLDYLMIKFASKEAVEKYFFLDISRSHLVANAEEARREKHERRKSYIEEARTKWENASKADVIGIIEFIRKYPDTPYAALAQEFVGKFTDQISSTPQNTKPDQVARIDKLLKAIYASNIRVDFPEEVTVGETTTVSVYLGANEGGDTVSQITSLREKLADLSEMSGRKFRIPTTLYVELRGAGFQIENVTPPDQLLNAGLIIPWKWYVNSKEAGDLTIDIMISADLSDSEGSSKKPFELITHQIKSSVNYTTKILEIFEKNFQYILGAMLLPAAIWAANLLRRRLPFGKEKRVEQPGGNRIDSV